MPRTHLVAYTARTSDGITHGVARVLSEQERPSWQECAEQIPGYLTDEDLGTSDPNSKEPEPMSQNITSTEGNPTDRDPAYASDDELIADLQRQLGITIAAGEAAEARGEQVPLSGMPGFESWKRAALRAAGETYTIIRGQRVPLS